MSDSKATKRVILSGASGALGKAIAAKISGAGYEIARLVRAAPSGGDIQWDPSAGMLDEAKLTGAHAFVHLSGENLASGRWNDAKKREILESRTKSTALLANAIAKMNPKPAAFLVASAIGYYGSSRGDEELTEASSTGDDFLASVCRAWEAASEPASGAGIRTVNLRFGVVLAKEGSALAKMLPVFKLGLGARIGSGKQVISWVGLEDAARATLFALETESLRGPVNVVAPRPVTNGEFTEKLAKAVGKGTALPVPAFVIRAAYGEMGKETILASQRVVPQKLVEAGFEFAHGGLLSALRAELEGSK